jgi:HemY protein
VKALFWITALFAIAVGLVIAARYNDGYVLLVVPPYRIEVALNLLLLLVGAGFVLLFVLVRLISTALLMPSRVRQYRLARRRDRAQSSLLSALEAYLEGRYSKAEQHALEAIDLGENTRLAAIIAARAAHEMRAYNRRDAHLERAAGGAPENDPLRAITEAELLLDQRRPQEALERLKKLPRRRAAALRLELKALQQMRQWDTVAAIAPELELRGVFDSEQADKLRMHAIAESLKRKAGDGYALDEAWKKLSDAEKRETPIAAAATQSYIALGRGVEAQAIVEQSLESTWDAELVTLYSELAGRDTVRQIERAEGWLKGHAKDAALLFTLGRLCARQALWGKAESYLDASNSVEPTYIAHLELARLHEKLGNTEAAGRHYRQSLELALAKLRKQRPASPA